jgi:hypothetical protein
MLRIAGWKLRAMAMIGLAVAFLRARAGRGVRSQTRSSRR